MLLFVVSSVAAAAAAAAGPRCAIEYRIGSLDATNEQTYARYNLFYSRKKKERTVFKCMLRGGFGRKYCGGQSSTYV